MRLSWRIALKSLVEVWNLQRRADSESDSTAAALETVPRSRNAYAALWLLRVGIESRTRTKNQKNTDANDADDHGKEQTSSSRWTRC